MVKKIIEERREWISLVLLTASVAFAVLILLKVTSYFAQSANAENIVRQAVKHNKPGEEDTKKRLAKGREVAGALKSRNLFAPPAPKTHPVKGVEGIFGDEVLIGGKWYKEGAKIADATVLSIEPTKVIVEWEGQKKVFAPMQASGEGGPSARGDSSRSSRGDRGGDRPSGGAQRVDSSGGPRPAMAGFGGGPGGGFREGMGDMRARWDSMSEREREDFRSRMRDRFGGGGHGGPGGGRPGGMGGRPGGDFGGRGGSSGRGGPGGRGR